MPDARSTTYLTIGFFVVVLGVVGGFVLARGGIAAAIEQFHHLVGLPVAASDVVTVNAEIPNQSIPVLENDRDSNEDPLEIIGAVGADHGSVTYRGTSLTYSPEPGFVGDDVIRYTIRDPGGGMSSATVVIEVVRNAAPIALPDREVMGRAGGSIDVLANDHDPDGHRLTVVDTGNARGGTVSVRAGLVQYAPAADFAGIDLVPYTVADELGRESSAWVEVNVPGPTCTGADDPALDEDADGYDNADEHLNETAPCDAASVPADADMDRTSDRLDVFFLDPHDGLANALPFEVSFDAPVGGTLLETGLTGVMANGQPPDGLYDPARIRLEDSRLGIDSSPAGDAFGAQNDQLNALQVGIRMPDEPFVVHGRLVGPFAAERFQSAGIYIGSGGQDDYLKLAVSAAGGEGGVKITYEVAGEGRGAAMRQDERVITTAQTVDLYIEVDPATGMTRSSYALDGGEPHGLGESGHLPIPESWTAGPRALAVGVIVTPELGGHPYTGRWDQLRVSLATE